MTLLLLAAFSSAAEFTEVPEAMSVLGGLEYRTTQGTGRLLEAGVPISDRQLRRHDLSLSGAFSPATGIAITIDATFTPSLQLSYPGSRSMIIEPLAGSGSYLSGEPLDETPVVSASGLAGVWLGGAVVPFSEHYERAQRTSWRIEAAVRTPSARRNLWTAPRGTRGVAPGGAAVRTSAAFSTDRGNAAPWLRVAYQHELPVVVDVTDEAGLTWVTGLSLRPASSLALDSGLELAVVRGDASRPGLRLNASLGGEYRTWEDVATGVYLPNVLDGGRAIPVTVGDSLAGRAELGVLVAIRPTVRARTGLGIVYRTPYRVEHVYPVTTSADSWQLDWTVRFEGVTSLSKG